MGGPNSPPPPNPPVEAPVPAPVPNPPVDVPVPAVVPAPVVPPNSALGGFAAGAEPKMPPPEFPPNKFPPVVVVVFVAGVAAGVVDPKRPPPVPVAPPPPNSLPPAGFGAPNMPPVAGAVLAGNVQASAPQIHSMYQVYQERRIREALTLSKGSTGCRPPRRVSE